MRNNGNRTTKTKIYIAKDKLLIWWNFSISTIFILLLLAFSLKIYGAINGKTFLKLILDTVLLLIIADILWQYKIKRITLAFEKKYIRMNKKQYLYSQIEKYWLGKTQDVFDGIFFKGWVVHGRRLDERFLAPFPETHKMLYIQVKGEIFPYRFDLKNNFSNQEAEEILENLKKSPIKNACGKEYIDFSILWWSMIMILWIALIIFEAFY